MSPSRPVKNSELESSLEAYFYLQVRKVLGGIPVKVAPTTVGVPDRYVLLPGGVIKLVELKTERGTVSPRQRAWHRNALERCGVVVDVVVGRSGVDSWVRIQAEGLSA